MIAFCSSSIANFKPGLQRKYPHAKWPRLGRYGSSAVFFGMYHIMDVLRLVWHKNSIVVWCGSDILNMQKSPFLLWIVQCCNERHICENEVERRALEGLGIEVGVMPQLFDCIEESEISFKHSERLQAYLCAHEGREEEYGVFEIDLVAEFLPDVDFHIYGIEGTSTNPNVFLHGRVSDEQFREEIRKYHVAIRLNKFDGFSEVLARSAIMGQYQISRIQYPHMFHAPDADSMIEHLVRLRDKIEPNYIGREYWIEKLSEKFI